MIAYPDDLYYTREHEWIRVEDNIAMIGITDFAQSELGDIVYVEVESVGDTLEKEAIFGTVEAVKTTSDLFMPVSGKVLEFNTDLDSSNGDNPALVNQDPYGDGWMVKMTIADPTEIEKLLSVEEYKSLIGA